MTTTYDLASVQQFASNLQDRLEKCEGGFCEDLDNSLRCTYDLCHELRTEINRWAGEVFTGRQPFDAEVEAVFRDELWRTLAKAESLAVLGEESKYDCVPLQWLNPLKNRAQDLRYLWENWVSPCRSVGPGPRVEIGEAARAEIAGRVGGLPPLPADWRPTYQPDSPVFRHRTK